MPRPILFLDDGGVMNDNSLRGPQWQRLVGEYFPPLLGGDPESWAEANRIVISDFFRPDAWRARVSLFTDYATFDYNYQLEWLTRMCDLVGVLCPPDEECVALARQATAWIIPRVHAAYPGAADTVRHLYLKGYTLYTSSNEPSHDLRGHLGGMGIRDCFVRLYGPDLLDIPSKSGPLFYSRLFAHAEVNPADALVLDDNPEVLSWAKALGARTLLVNANAPNPHNTAAPVIGSLTELPAFLEAINKKEGE